MRRFFNARETDTGIEMLKPSRRFTGKRRVDKKLAHQVLTLVFIPNSRYIGGGNPRGLACVGALHGVCLMVLVSSWHEGRFDETVSSRLSTAIAINRYYLFSPLVCSGKVGDIHRGE